MRGRSVEPFIASSSGAGVDIKHTVRGRSVESFIASSSGAGVDIQRSPTTVRPLTSGLPSSLRLLFDSGMSDNSENFRGTGLPVPAETTRFYQGFHFHLFVVYYIDIHFADPELPHPFPADTSSPDSSPQNPPPAAMAVGGDLAVLSLLLESPFQLSSADVDQPHSSDPLDPPSVATTSSHHSQPPTPREWQVNMVYGPAIPPLDFEVITSSHEETHEILAEVVDDLSQWLSAAEVGLTQILDAMGEDY